MKYQVRKAVVIGSGTMGAAIAAHLANIGVPVALLDIVPNSLSPKEEKKGLTLDAPIVRNRIAQEGLERARNHVRRASSQPKMQTWFQSVILRMILMSSIKPIG